MGRIVVTEFVSLDGVMEEPQWSLPYWNDEIAAFKTEEMAPAEALLLGRRTYEGFAAAWPSRSGDDYTDKFNAMTKYVVTSTLDSFEWSGARRLEGGDVASAVKALRERADGDVVVHGSCRLAQELLRQGLVDELRLVVYPLALGSGKRLLDGVDVKLRLVSAQPTTNGVLLLRYQP